MSREGKSTETENHVGGERNETTDNGCDVFSSLGDENVPKLYWGDDGAIL